MADAVESYLRAGSPFRIEVDPSELNFMIRDLFENADDDPPYVIAFNLTLGGVTPAVRGLSHKSSTTSASREDMVHYATGFYRPLMLLLATHMARTTGLSMTRTMYSWMDPDIDHTFELTHLELGATLLHA
ncbi:MAG: hypothetical protein ACRDHP_12335, partial [Ktedonobacterales bacterium]